MTAERTLLLALDAPPAPASEIEVLAANGFDGDLLEAPGLNEDAFEAALARATVLLTWRAPAEAALLERARRCLLLVHYGPGAGPGVARVDLEAARRLGIYVSSVPDYATDDWADEALLAIVRAARRNNPRELAALRIGIVGLGQVGRAVARRLVPFGAELWGHDPFASADLFQNEHVRPAPLEELFGICDIVTLHLPLIETTAGMIGADLLGRMKEGSALVCIAPAGVVDLAALDGAIGCGRPGVAFFDEDLAETLAAGDPLLASPAVIHGTRRAGTGMSSLEGRRRRAALDAAHLRRGNRPAHLLIDPPCPRHALVLAGQEID